MGRGAYLRLSGGRRDKAYLKLRKGGKANMDTSALLHHIDRR